jgi:hypothetical protein
MPYRSEKQRRFFHTETAKKAGITAAEVKEFDHASKGMSLPEAIKHKKSHEKRKKMYRGGMVK